MEREKIHSLQEIEKNISKKKYNELLELSEKVIKSLSSTSTDSEVEKYRTITEANKSLKNGLEKDLFASNIAYPDEEIFTAILKMNGINIMDILIATSKTQEKQKIIESLKKLENFRRKYYNSTLIIDLINKLNQIIVFKPNLLTSAEEIDKLANTNIIK